MSVESNFPEFAQDAVNLASEKLGAVAVDCSDDFLQTSNGCCLMRNRNSTKDDLMHTVSIWMAGNRDVDAVVALTGVWCSWQFLESLLDSTSIRPTLRVTIPRVHRFRVLQASTGPRMMTGSNSWVK